MSATLWPWKNLSVLQRPELARRLSFQIQGKSCKIKLKPIPTTRLRPKNKFYSTQFFIGLYQALAHDHFCKTSIKQVTSCTICWFYIIQIIFKGPFGLYLIYTCVHGESLVPFFHTTNGVTKWFHNCLRVPDQLELIKGSLIALVTVGYLPY